MPLIIHTKPVMYTVKELLHTLKTRDAAARPTTPFTGRQHPLHRHRWAAASCGLAHMLLDFDALVSGTDRTPSAVTRELAQGRAPPSVMNKTPPHVAQGTEIVVHSAAIGPQTHPEDGRRPPARLRNRQIRPDARPRHVSLRHGIAVAGTHGKSTTTAMTAHVLLSVGQRPLLRRRQPPSSSSAARHRSEQWRTLASSEACEYDRSFHNLKPRIAVAVLNIEEDHLDYYKDIDEIVASFATFLSRRRSRG